MNDRYLNPENENLSRSLGSKSDSFSGNGVTNGYAHDSKTKYSELNHNNPGRNNNWKKYKKGVLILLSAGLLLFGACCFFYFGADKEVDDSTVVSVKPSTVSLDPVVSSLGSFGIVEMKGLFGAVPSSIVLNFENQTGHRFYNSTPGNLYRLRLKEAHTDGDDAYELIYTDLLEGRIPVGTFRGKFDGNKFSGIYTSTHGQTREFSYEKK